jgi:hypothetical protein
VDEMTLLREFRLEKEAPEAGARQAARVALLNAIDAAAPTPGTRRTRIRRPRRALVTAVAAAALAVTLLALIPRQFSERHQLTLVDRALAAVSQGPILHAVLQVPTAMTASGPGGVHPDVAIINLATGKERQPQTTTEYWYDPQRGLLHSKTRVDGGLVWDSLQTTRQSLSNMSRPRASGGRPALDPGLSAFLVGYRAALKAGKAHDAGTARINGREVRWLRFPLARGNSEEIGLDARSFEPLYLHVRCPLCTAAPPTQRIVTLEGLSRESANFVALVRRRSASNGRYANTERRLIALREAPRLLKHMVLWAGPRRGSLKLSVVTFSNDSRHSALPITTENTVGRGLGVGLIYGAQKTAHGGYRVASGQPYVGITQTTSWRYGPGNFEDLGVGHPLAMGAIPFPREGEAVLHSTPDRKYWSVQLKKNGLYVEVDASSRALAVDTARELRPLRR